MIYTSNNKTGQNDLTFDLLHNDANTRESLRESPLVWLPAVTEACGTAKADRQLDQRRCNSRLTLNVVFSRRWRKYTVNIEKGRYS